MVVVQRRFCPLLNPVGSSRGVLYSDRYFTLFMMVVIVPSLVVTVVVCLLAYLADRALRRGQKAKGALMLIAALSPFILYAGSLVQSILADRERARPLAGLAKVGPVTSYPDILVVQGVFRTKAEPARLMLAGGFQEVDVIFRELIDKKYQDIPQTFAVAPVPGCREALEAWAAQSGADSFSPGAHNLDRCLSITKWDQQAPERSSAVVLLMGSFTGFKRCCRRSLGLERYAPPLYDDLEIRIKDGSKDVLVDYWLAPSDRPMFPLFVRLGGFVEQTTLGMSPVAFVVRNLKR
jgi:hypothetical protein